VTGAPALSPEEFQSLTAVSRETLQRLQAYAELLTAWNRRINLVGPGTIDDLWRRHILDSAQLAPLLPPGTRILVDLGSGAGLPGLILALLGVPEVHLIESDARKSAFLREALRVTGTRGQVHARRIDTVPPFPADVITARAFAPLTSLLSEGSRFAADHTIWLLLKGKAVAEELTAARERWNMRAESVKSLSDPSGAILRLENVRRA
jgi:16S rRNA (guanine527-N7)-methyltransferase